MRREGYPVVLVCWLASFMLSLSLGPADTLPTVAFLLAPIAYARGVHLINTKTFSMATLDGEMLQVIIMLAVDAVLYACATPLIEYVAAARGGEADGGAGSFAALLLHPLRRRTAPPPPSATSKPGGGAAASGDTDEEDDDVRAARASAFASLAWLQGNGYATLPTVRVSITPRAPGAAQATQLTLTATHGPPLHQRARHPSKELSEGAPQREPQEEEGAGRARAWR